LRGRWTRGDPLYVGQEAIATAAYSFYKTGIASRVVQDSPKFVDGAADVVIKVNKGAIRPSALAQFIATDDFAGPLQQTNQ
jgi:hypothetical protein